MKHLTQAELERLYRNWPQVAKDGIGLATFCRLYRGLEDIDSVPEGCTPADAKVLREANHKLAQELHDVKTERDEADRRAGAAERRSADLQEGADRRASWLRRAKAEAGYEDRISFDIVWAETLAKAKDGCKPIDMVLHCTKCGLQHIDAPEWVDDPHDIEQGRIMSWRNEPHRSHLCHGCGHIWRPADVPTNGVAKVETKGKADSPIAAQMAAQPVAQEPAGRLHADGYFTWHRRDGYVMDRRLPCDFYLDPPAAQAVDANLAPEQFTAGAKAMAQAFDYPWDTMPSQGQERMHQNVRRVLAAMGVPC